MRLDSSFTLENFKVIPPPTYEISFAEIKISPKTLFFTATTVSELSYTPDIAFFFNPEEHILAVSPSAKSEFSCPFFDPAQVRKNVTILHEPLAAAMRATMKWPARKGTYRVPGVRIPNSPQILLCFDLSLGTCSKRDTRKVDPQTFLSVCPSIQEVESPGSNFIPFALPPNTATGTKNPRNKNVIDVQYVVS